jgi:hypothetical protein
MWGILYLIKSLDSIERSVEMTCRVRFSSCVSLVDQLRGDIKFAPFLTTQDLDPAFAKLLSCSTDFLFYIRIRFRIRQMNKFRLIVILHYILTNTHCQVELLYSRSHDKHYGPIMTYRVALQDRSLCQLYSFAELRHTDVEYPI